MSQILSPIAGHQQHSVSDMACGGSIILINNNGYIFFVFVVKLVANFSSREVLVTQVTWTNKLKEKYYRDIYCHK